LIVKRLNTVIEVSNKKCNGLNLTSPQGKPRAEGAEQASVERIHAKGNF